MAGLGGLGEHRECRALRTASPQCEVWPETYLPTFLHAARPTRPLSIRVLSVHYVASMKPTDTPQPSLSFQEHAHYIRNELQRAGVGKRPVVFVAHSMGGLVLKQILCEEYAE